MAYANGGLSTSGSGGASCHLEIQRIASQIPITSTGAVFGEESAGEARELAFSKRDSSIRLHFTDYCLNASATFGRQELR